MRETRRDRVKESMSERAFIREKETEKGNKGKYVSERLCQRKREREIEGERGIYLL